MNKTCLDGIPVTLKLLPGNLHAITLPVADEITKTRIATLDGKLREKCGAISLSVLLDRDRYNLPVDRTLVMTDDSYVHILPLHCDKT